MLSRNPDDYVRETKLDLQRGERGERGGETGAGLGPARPRLPPAREGRGQRRRRQGRHSGACRPCPAAELPAGEGVSQLRAAEPRAGSACSPSRRRARPVGNRRCAHALARSSCSGPYPPCGGGVAGLRPSRRALPPLPAPGGERGLLGVLGVSERGLGTPLELERGAGPLVTGLDLPGCSQCYPRYPWHSIAFTAGCFPLHLILLPAYPLLKLAKILYVLNVVFTSSNCSLVAVVMTVPALFSSSSSRTGLQFHLCNVIEIRFSFYLV